MPGVTMDAATGNVVRRGIKRRAITLEQKLRVIKEIESNPQEPRASVADRLGIPVTTLKSIYVKKDEIRRYAAEAGPSGSKRSRSQNGMYSELEKVLFEWFREQRDSNKPVSGNQLKERALEMAREMNIAHTFKASSGWVDKFRKRHGIAGRGNAAEIACSDIETDVLWKESRLPELTNNYKPCDIYNLGETGLCLDLPNKFSGAKDELDKEIMRRRRKKGRLTVLVGVNADGSDKLPLLVIGKDRSPQCSEAVQTLPTEYACDPKAWMTPSLFTSQLEKLNDRMRQERRNVLVFADASPAHPTNLQLSNIQIQFFPPNCSSRVQPLHLGIIAALKIRFKKLQVQRALASLQQADHSLSPQLSTLEAMHFVTAAWHDIPAESISKCYRLAGIASDGATEPTQADELSLYGSTLPLHIEMDIGETPNDWHKISDRIDYTDFICQNDNLDVCDRRPGIKVETLSDSGDSSDETNVEDTEGPLDFASMCQMKIKTQPDSGDSSSDEANASHRTEHAENTRDSKLTPTFIEALRAYETAARYITSRNLPQKDIAVVTDFARVLYDAHALEEMQTNTSSFNNLPKQ